MARICDDQPSPLRRGATVRTRRELLRAAGAGLPVVAMVAFAGSACGFSREEMTAKIAKLYRDRCAADPLHAATLDGALARLDAAGIKYDRAELAATLICPVCGCSIISGAEALDRTHEDQPRF